MGQKTEKMLPKKSASIAGDIQGLAADDKAAGQEKAAAGEPIHQLHDACRFKRGESEEEKKRGDELRPDKERETHPGQPLGPKLDDGHDDIDRTQEGGSN